MPAFFPPVTGQKALKAQSVFGTTVKALERVSPYTNSHLSLAQGWWCQKPLPSSMNLSPLVSELPQNLT